MTNNVLPKSLHPKYDVFMECDKSIEDARIILFGAPFDSTTSYRPGARFGSAAIRRESYGIESYSSYQDKDLIDCPVLDCGDLELPIGDTEKVLAQIEVYTDEILQADKIPFLLGGEHLVTLGAFRAVHRKYPEVVIVHLDAHGDLRDDYLGVKLSHACVVRRCWEVMYDGVKRDKVMCDDASLDKVVGDEVAYDKVLYDEEVRSDSSVSANDHRIFQFGIRSGAREEFTWGKSHVNTQFYNLDGLAELGNQLQGKPVYLTVDLDVLDPSVFPGTGTPEPGGISFEELRKGLTLICQKLAVVGCDVNELCPPYDSSGISTAAACKVVREMLLAL